MTAANRIYSNLLYDNASPSRPAEKPKLRSEFVNADPLRSFFPTTTELFRASHRSVTFPGRVFHGAYFIYADSVAVEPPSKYS